jgi:hypothetical protein
MIRSDFVRSKELVGDEGNSSLCWSGLPQPLLFDVNRDAVSHFCGIPLSDWHGLESWLCLLVQWWDSMVHTLDVAVVEY